MVRAVRPNRQEQTFSVDLQPPNPILVSPPLQIVRSPPADDPYNDKVLQPAEQHIDIIVEFPDGHKRPLVRTTLYVDGQVVAENKVEPFDAFTWDLSGIPQQRRAQDRGRSRGCAQPEQDQHGNPGDRHGHPGAARRWRPSLAATASTSPGARWALAGLVLLLILFVGRLPAIFSRRRTSRQAQVDPVTQSVAADAGATRPMHGRTTKRRRVVSTNGNAPAAEAAAHLRALQPDPLAAPGQTFKPAPGSPSRWPLTRSRLGPIPRNPATCWTTRPCDARHARITKTAGGDYFIVDAGTIGGTWVNFEPVGQTAHLLQHGDLIHFGQLVFRFELKEPPPPVQPRISKPPPQS